jgi:O-antigen ligase
LAYGSYTLQSDVAGLTFRLGGPLGDYELYSEMLGLAVVCQLHALLHARGVRLKGFWSVALALTLAAALLTSTRGGAVMIVLGAILLLVLGRQRSAWVTFASVGFGSIALALSSVLGASVTARFGGDSLLGRFGSITTSAGLSGLLNRTDVWGVFTESVRWQRQSLFGAGPQFDFLAWGTYPHSLPIYLITTIGIVGLVLFGAFLALLLFRIGRSALRTNHAAKSTVLGAVLLVTWIASEVKIEYLRVPSYALFVWAFLGAVAAAASLEPDSAVGSPESSRSGKRIPTERQQ